MQAASTLVCRPLDRPPGRRRLLNSSDEDRDGETAMNRAPNAAVVAAEVAEALESRQVDYAIGGALALGFWGEPRGTLDVDVTLFLPLDDTEGCLQLLRAIGCEFDSTEATSLLREHHFCRAIRDGRRVDVFLPMHEFYQVARDRRVRTELEGRQVYVWSAEVLAVFKMMFFREKDILDAKQIVQIQADQLDRDWIRERLVEIFGPRDPRIPAWDKLVADTPVE